MKLRTIAFCLLLAAGAASAQDAAPPAAPISLDEYDARLQAWREEISLRRDDPSKLLEFNQSLPDSLTVEENAQQFIVDLKPLKDSIRRAVEKPKGATSLDAADRDKEDKATKDDDDPGREKPRTKPEAPVTIENSLQRIGYMQRSAARYRNEAHPFPSARGRYDDILSRREFDGVRGPGVMKQFRDQMLERFFRFLNKLFQREVDRGIFGQVVIWICIAAGAALLALYLYRLAKRREPEVRREIVPFSPSAKGWRRWLDDAKQAAQRGDWREAIHLAYWAGISRLEEGGAWIPDRARTPREYLRLLSQSSEHRPALTTLTRRFELAWYAQRPAGQAEFTEAIADLEKLGCR